MKLELQKGRSDFGLELINENGNSCKIDAAESIGGSGAEFRPMELLAGSIAACMSIDLLAIMKKQRLPTDNYRVEITAKRKDAIPTPFEIIHLRVLVDQGIDIERLQRNAEMVLNKYCSVSASLEPGIEIKVEVTHSNENR